MSAEDFIKLAHEDYADLICTHSAGIICFTNRERQLLFKRKSNDSSDEESAELEKIIQLRESSTDEIAKAEIDLNAPLLDSHGHLIVKHDLFNHDGLTEDGIAEAFIEFAKKERLSFFH